MQPAKARRDSEGTGGRSAVRTRGRPRMITGIRSCCHGASQHFPNDANAVARHWLPVVCVAPLALILGLSAPARADVTVTATPTSVRQGDRIQVSAVTAKKAKWCSFYTRKVGAKRKLVSTKKATRGRASIQLRTASLSPGTYIAVVFCGRQNGDAAGGSPSLRHPKRPRNPPGHLQRAHRHRPRPPESHANQSS